MFRYVRLLPVILASGCASLQDSFCGMIEPDSYVLVSVANCQTTQISVDYETDAGFADLKSYAWILEGHTGTTDTGTRAGRQPHAWVTDSVNATLTAKGFRLDQAAPDFLVSQDVPVDMQGTLTLTFFNARTRQTLWRGSAVDEAYPARNTGAWENRIRAAVDMLLERFPPARHAGPGDTSP